MAKPAEEEKKFTRERYVSAISGYNVKDTYDYPYVKYGNGGYQYEGLKDKSERSSNYNSDMEKNDMEASRRNRIPSYLMREDYSSSRNVANYPANERTHIPAPQKPVEVKRVEEPVQKPAPVEEVAPRVVEEVRPEGGYGVGNQKTMKALMYLQAALEFLIHDNHNKVTIEYVYPSSWRASCGIKNGRGIKRTSLKEADIQFVKDTYGVSVGDDEADAICIGHAQFNQKSNEINWE